MKQTKTTFKIFTISDHEKEETYLRNMHKSGWKFVQVRMPGFYLFEQCEPEDVIYQLDYNQDGEKQLNEYKQLFEDCGWEYIQSCVGYSYFRKPVRELKSEDEAIFNNDGSRTEMLNRVFKGRVFPLCILFLLIIVPGLVRTVSEGVTALSVAYIILLVLYIFIFVSFGVRYYITSNKK